MLGTVTRDHDVQRGHLAQQCRGGHQIVDAFLRVEARDGEAHRVAGADPDRREIRRAGGAKAGQVEPVVDDPHAAGPTVEYIARVACHRIGVGDEQARRPAARLQQRGERLAGAAAVHRD